MSRKKKHKPMPFDDVVKQLVNTPPQQLKSTKIGSNIFTGFSIPIVVDNRYFILEKAEPPLISVCLILDNKLLYEIHRNRPKFDNSSIDISSTTDGIISVTDKESGRLLYRFRPDSKTSIIFGKIAGETTVSIRDEAIYVGGVRYQHNIISGVQIGVFLDSKGNKMGLGSNKIPPAIIEAFFQ